MDQRNINSKKAKEQIRGWLLEAGFQIREVPNNNAIFNFSATDTDGRTINIAQPNNREDQIIIITKAILDSSRIESMSEDKRTEFLWHLRFSLLNSGVGFSGVELPLDEIELSLPLYFDALTKDQFMYRLFKLRRTLLLITWIYNREFHEPPRSIGFSPS